MSKPEYVHSFLPYTFNPNNKEHLNVLHRDFEQFDIIWVIYEEMTQELQCSLKLTNHKCLFCCARCMYCPNSDINSVDSCVEGYVVKGILRVPQKQEMR